MSYASVCLADGAVGFYQMSEGSGTVAVDQKAASNGIYQNAGGLTLVQPGIPGGGGLTAAKFVAGTGYIAVPDTASQRVVDTFTQECWVKLTATAVNKGLGGAGNAGDTGWDWYISGSGGLIGIEHSNVAAMGASTIAVPTADGIFHHLVWTKATSTNKIYIDGVDVTGAITNSTIGATTNGFNMAGINGGGRPFDGTMAMYGIYPTALTAAKVANHYTLGATLFGYVLPGLPGLHLPAVSRAALR